MAFSRLEKNEIIEDTGEFLPPDTYGVSIQAGEILEWVKKEMMKEVCFSR